MIGEAWRADRDVYQIVLRDKDGGLAVGLNDLAQVLAVSQESRSSLTPRGLSANGPKGTPNLFLGVSDEEARLWIRDRSGTTVHDLRIDKTVAKKEMDNPLSKLTELSVVS